MVHVDRFMHRTVIYVAHGRDCNLGAEILGNCASASGTFGTQWVRGMIKVSKIHRALKVMHF